METVPQSPGNSRKSIFNLAMGLVVLLFIVEAAKLTIFFAALPAQRNWDAAQYWALGEQVAAGDIWMAQHPVAFRTPGYPWLIGAAQAIAGRHAWMTIIGLQYLAVFLTTIVTTWWTFHLTRRVWLAVFALLICVLSAARASHASSLMTETLFTLSLTLTLISFCSLDNHSRLRMASFQGLCWGISWLLRPVAVTLVPAWLASCWLARKSNDPIPARTRWISMIITAVLLLAMLCPWVIRNRTLFQRSSLTVFLGRELWLITFGPGQPAAHPLPDTSNTQRLREAVLSQGDFTAWDGNWTVSHRLTAAGLTDVEADELMRTVSIEAIRRSPLRSIARGIWRIIDFWRSVYSRPLAFLEESNSPASHDPTAWNQPTCQRFRDAWLNNAWEGRLLGIELTSLLALVGLAGMWLSPRTWKTAMIMTLAIGGVAFASAAVEYPSYRYRMVLEPSMIVCALTGWSIIIDVIRRGTKSLWQSNACEA